MIKLKCIIRESLNVGVMWTYENAKAVANKLGGVIVGSVKTCGYSNHDLDIKVARYTDSILHLLSDMGYEFSGSQVVSPNEIRKSRKFGRQNKFWMRNYIFQNKNENKKIEIWVVEI